MIFLAIKKWGIIMKKKVLIFIVSLLLILVGFFLYPSYKTAGLKESNNQYLTEMENQATDIETPVVVDEQSEELATEEPDVSNQDKVIVIDAGHQQNNDSSTEPIGPGSNESKPRVSAGTRGTISGVPEYELNLTLALRLQDALETKGYTVVMCRTQNDVHISNSERAQIANSVGADIFIRIHANGSSDSSANGAMTICQTNENPYNSELYEESKLLSEIILDELVSSTGCSREYVWETDTMSGINWSQVPTTIVEVGYMTNPDEEALLLSDSYQQLIVAGLVNGIDRYFVEISNY